MKKRVGQNTFNVTIVRLEMNKKFQWSKISRVTSQDVLRPAKEALFKAERVITYFYFKCAASKQGKVL